MGLQKQFDNEENILERQLSEGSIDIQEYNKAMRELAKDARAAIREEAQDAYDDIIDNY
jgi:hypothetical protein